MKATLFLLLTSLTLASCSTSKCVSRDFDNCYANESTDNLYGR